MFIVDVYVPERLNTPPSYIPVPLSVNELKLEFVMEIEKVFDSSVIVSRMIGLF
jgi:hypothetical protein